MQRLLLLAALTAAVFPATALAQVANGNFDRGAADWTWRDSIHAMAAGTSCANVGYAAVTNANSTVRNAKWLAPASGRVGLLVPPKPYAVGTWGMCRQMEQTVYVPRGAKLTFALRIGNALQTNFNMPHVFGAVFSVVIVDGAKSSTVYSVSGQSRACDQWLPCPAFTNRTVDLAPYWGKQVRLIFRGGSAGQNTQTSQVYGEPSPIYIDHVRIQ